MFPKLECASESGPALTGPTARDSSPWTGVRPAWALGFPSQAMPVLPVLGPLREQGVCRSPEQDVSHLSATFQTPSVKGWELLIISMRKGCTSVCLYVGFSEGREQPLGKRRV